MVEFKEFTYKDLVIGFTTSFRLIWNDQGSGGSYNGAYWRPKVPADMKGFYPVGDLGWSDYDKLDKVNDEAVIAVVKDANGSNGSALRRPIKYEQVWYDKGTGSDMNGSMWRPVPPRRYVAMGLVCNKEWHNAPSLDEVMCVRNDLVVPASPGNMIWCDKLTGGHRSWLFSRIYKNLSSNWFGSWRIEPPTAAAGEVHFSAGTFIGANSYDPPDDDPNAYAFRILIPEETQQMTLPEPELHGYSKPPELQENKVASASILPWFAVNDPKLPPVARIVKSPTYKLRRVDCFKMIGFGHNDSTTTQESSWSYTKGKSGSDTTTFSETTGIEVGIGIEVKKVINVSAKLSQSFTYSSSSTSGWEQSETVTVSAKIPPGKALAAYVIHSTYELFREDGSQVVSTDVKYDHADNILWKEYPPAPKPETAVKTD